MFTSEMSSTVQDMKHMNMQGTETLPLPIISFLSLFWADILLLPSTEYRIYVSCPNHN